MSRNSVAPRVGSTRAWLAAGLVSAVLLTGCQPSDGATTPPPSVTPFPPTVSTSASPTPSRTPTPSPSPSLVVTARPTTPEETAALAAEAEFVYREMRRLMDEYEAKGGAATLPEPLKAYVDDPYAAALEGTLKYTYEQGRRIEGSTQVTKVAAFVSGLQTGTLIGVQFCDDQSKLTYVTKEGERAPLDFRVMNHAQFSRGSDGKLRMTENVSTEVKTCGA